MNATKTMTLEEFRIAYPVFQATQTGKWGWRRIAGCANLGSARFGSQAEAESDRDETYSAVYLVEMRRSGRTSLSR